VDVRKLKAERRRENVKRAVAGRDVTRREFVKDTASMAAAAALGIHGVAHGAVNAPDSMPRTVLGRTGVEVSRLGVGCAMFRRVRVTPDDVAAVLHRALERGVDYFDTAPNYGSGKEGYSEEKMGPTIKEIRDRVFLVTKTEEPTYEGTWQLLRQSMVRMQTDHLDLVHLHNFGMESRFEDLDFLFSDEGALGALREAKKQGIIRFIGASGHVYPQRFHKVLDTGEIDVLMNAVNFVVRHTYNFEDKVWSRACGENLGLVAMKVLGGSARQGGYRIPVERHCYAIRYALDVPGCHVAVIGCETLAEFEQAADAVASYTPLDEDERLILAKEGLDLAVTRPWKQAYGPPIT
jgi:uncharacterized protein